MGVKVEASAPSNIALIKYMGKSERAANCPANASLSYTLESLRTYVEIEEGPSTWEPLRGFTELRLSETGRARFLAHFERLKGAMEIGGRYTVRSANSFPADCGLASSASSFAALTLATYELARRLRPGFELTATELSALSRLGSGSSCRSFFTPWAVWRGGGAEALDLPLRLEHAVVLVEEGRKDVSSSQAHERIQTSLLYRGRPERAEERLHELTQALSTNRWNQAFEVCWSEFWDMHSLFETSHPCFGYLTGSSLDVLARLREVWRTAGDGPLVTMDAGPNVHVLLRSDQIGEAARWLQGWRTITSWVKR